MSSKHGGYNIFKLSARLHVRGRMIEKTQLLFIQFDPCVMDVEPPLYFFELSESPRARSKAELDRTK